MAREVGGKHASTGFRGGRCGLIATIKVLAVAVRSDYSWTTPVLPHSHGYGTEKQEAFAPAGSCLRNASASSVATRRAKDGAAADQRHVEITGRLRRRRLRSRSTLRSSWTNTALPGDCWA
jgi:hypothetical protein